MLSPVAPEATIAARTNVFKQPALPCYRTNKRKAKQGVDPAPTQVTRRPPKGSKPLLQQYHVEPTLIMPPPCAWIGLPWVSVQAVPGLMVTSAAEAGSAERASTAATAAAASPTTMRFIG